MTSLLSALFSATKPADVVQKRFKRQFEPEDEEINLTGEDLEDLSLLTNALQRLNDLNEADSGMESLFDPSDRDQNDFEEQNFADDRTGDLSPEDPAFEDQIDQDQLDIEESEPDTFGRQRRAPRSHLPYRVNHRNLYGYYRYGRSSPVPGDHIVHGDVEDAKREAWTGQDDEDLQNRLDNYDIVMV